MKINILFVCYIDFPKALDFVVRDNLWLKLNKFGVRGKFLQVIKSMYSSVKSKNKFNNSLSNAFCCNLGVRQGDCLSPFLFVMYLNDLEETFFLKGFKGVDIGMFKLFLLLYAHDIVIISETELGLNQGLTF